MLEVVPDWDYFANFDWKDFCDDNNLGIFAISCHAKLIGCDENSLICGRLEIIRVLISEEIKGHNIGQGAFW